MILDWVLLLDITEQTFGLSEIPLHALDEDAVGRIVLQDELEVLFANFDSSSDVVQKVRGLLISKERDFISSRLASGFYLSR